MTPKAKLLALAVLLTLFVGTYYAGYLKGWYAHSEHVNKVAAQKLQKSLKAVNVSESKAASANAKAKVVYRTVYRDMVKYVNKPDRTVCKFDDDAVRLRQRAIDTANNIPGFDEPAVQGK